MSITPPPNISPVPQPAPQRQDRATFSDRVDAFVRWLSAAVAQFMAVALNVANNATEAYNWALAAMQSASDAASAAAAAAASSNAVKWVSGTSYTDGFVVWSPITRYSYRRNGAGAGTTDPSNDAVNWVLLLYSSGLGGMVITGNIALVNTSPAAISVTPATPGLYATLPDATTVSKAAVVTIIKNEGIYDFGVKDFAGNQLGWVRPGDQCTVGLALNTTAAGKWDTNLQKLGITAFFNVASIAGITLRRIAVDANRTLFLFGSLYGVVYDASTQTWGTPTLIRIIPNGAMASGILAATDRVLIASCDGSTGIQTVVLSLSGTAITVGGVTTATAGSNVTVWGDFVAVGAAFAWSYFGASGGYVRAVTVSGTSSTVGTEVAYGNSLAMLFVSGSVLRAIGYNSAVCCQPYTVLGANLVAGSPSTQSASSPGGQGYRAFQNAAGNIVVFHDNSGTPYASVFKLTGTIEASTTAQIFATTASYSGLDYVQISATKTAIAGVSSAANVVLWNIHIDTAGVSSCGTADSFAQTGAAISAIGVSGNNARFSLYSGSDLFQPTQLQFDCSGVSPVRGNIQSRWGINSPGKNTFGKDARHPSLLSAGNNQYAIGGNHSYDASYNAANIQTLPALGENIIAGALGAAANESWLLSGLTSSSTTLGTTIKRVEAAA